MADETVVTQTTTVPAVDPTPGEPTGDTTTTSTTVTQVEVAPETPDAGGEVTLSPEQQKLFEKLLKTRLDVERAKYKDVPELRKQAAKLKGLEDAQKTEEQKTQDKLTALQAQVQAAESEAKTSKLQAAVAAEAARLRIDPKLAQKIIDADALTQGEDGEYTNLAEHLQAKIKEYGLQPRLAPQAAGAANPARETTLSRTDQDRFREYFGGGGGGFWSGGGVITPKE